jgi:DNA-binding protein H-NS
MSLKETLKEVISLLEQLIEDAHKSPKNQAATQRVRTGTIKLEKVAKRFRKESIQDHQAKKAVKVKAKETPKAKSSKERPVKKVRS